MLTALGIHLGSEFKSLDEYSKALPETWRLIEETGLFRPLYAQISPATKGEAPHLSSYLKLELARPSYDLGMSVNQRGAPTFDLTISYPSFAYKPFIFTSAINRSWDDSRTFSAELSFPRLLGGVSTLKAKCFSQVTSLGAGISSVERSRGGSIGLIRGRNCLEIVSVLRDISLLDSVNFDRLNDVEGNQLRSQRLSIRHSYNYDNLKFLRSNPTIPVRGISAKTVLEMPLIPGDSQSAKFMAMFYMYNRAFASVTSRFFLKGGVALKLRGSTVELPENCGKSLDNLNAAKELYPLDRFFLGGVNDPSLSFPGFAERSLPFCVKEGISGALGYLTLGSSINFSIPRLDIPGLRGICSAQAGFIAPTLTRETTLFRSSLGFGICVPVGLANLEVTFSLPINPGDEQLQIFQVGVSSGAG